MPRDIELTPEWGGIFRYAVAIVEAEIERDRGKEVVIQMLKFGERLYEASKEPERE